MTTKLHGWYIAGLFNTDGSFSLHVEENKQSRFKYRVIPVITLTQHENSKHILKLVKTYFNHGEIVKQNQNCFQYRIKSRQIIIEKIIPFFDKYTLIGFKFTQFMVFRHLVFLMQDKFHLSINGFYIFVSIILFINRFPNRKLKLENILISHEKNYGNCKVVYSENLKKLFILHLFKKDYNPKIKSLNPWFVLGLIEGDGGFSVSFLKTIKPSFYFSQESSTFFIFGLLQNFFHGGKIYSITNSYNRFMISDRKTLIHHVFPFFEKYSLYGEKKSILKFSNK